MGTLSFLSVIVFFGLDGDEREMAKRYFVYVDRSLHCFHLILQPFANNSSSRFVCVVQFFLSPSRLKKVDTQERTEKVTVLDVR
jgi:hypothetical protein